MWWLTNDKNVEIEHLANIIPSKSTKSEIAWPPLILTFAFLIGLGIYQDYGVTWDEPLQKNNGMVTLKHIGQLVAPEYIKSDVRFLHYPPIADFHDKDYGVAFELPLALFTTLLDLDDSREMYHFRHLITFILCFMGVLALFKLAKRRFSDYKYGLLAVIFFILSPKIFAEQFYNSKDAVFMALFAIALNSSVKFLDLPTFRNAFYAAFASAILIDVRIMGIVLPLMSLTLLILTTTFSQRTYVTVAISGVFYLMSTTILVVIFWPYLWDSPWDNFVLAFQNMTKFRWVGSVFYLGEIIPGREVPWHYILVWIGISTPILYLGLSLAGLANILLRALGNRLVFDFESIQDILFAGAFLGPVLAVIFFGSTLYDGWRQMYFVYPPFILIAAIGWRFVFRLRKGIWGWLVCAGTTIFLLHLTVWMWMAHPNQNVYFNFFAGKEFSKSFDMDYWGLSNRQALEYILEQDKRPEVRVWAGSAMQLDRGLLLMEKEERGRVLIVTDKNIADYIITNYRLNFTDYGSGIHNSSLFYQLKIDGQAILSVFKLRPALK